MNNSLSYGNMPIPKEEKKYTIIRWGWGGLNKKDKIDTGCITDANGITVDPPYVMPMKEPKMFFEYTGFKDPLSIFGYDDKIFSVYKDTSGGNTSINVQAFNPNGESIYDKKLYDVPNFDPSKSYQRGIIVLKDGKMYMSNEAIPAGPWNENNWRPYDEESMRTMVQFNVVDTSSGNIVAYKYDRKLLLYPDMYSIPYDLSGNPALFASADTPSSFYSTVYNSRVFGTNGDAVFCSAYNSYVDYSLDTADENGTSDAHAWWSMSQSNSKADGEITAMATYGNHVCVFKSDFFHLIYNNKNPFRIVDVGEYGCDNQYAVCEMDGNLYFASKDCVYRYSGGTPRKISDDLGIGDFSGAVLGSFRDTLYAYVNGKVYSYKYNSNKGTWSELGEVLDDDGNVVDIKQFATTDYGIAALTNDGKISYIEWDTDSAVADGADEDLWVETYPDEWWFETDLMAAGKLDVRRVKSVAVLCYIGSKGGKLSAYLLKDGEPFVEENALKIGSTEGDSETIKGFTLMRCLMRQTSAYMHRIRFVGKGNVTVHAAEVKISWGGELYVEG